MTMENRTLESITAEWLTYIYDETGYSPKPLFREIANEAYAKYEAPEYRWMDETDKLTRIDLFLEEAVHAYIDRIYSDEPERF